MGFTKFILCVIWSCILLSPGFLKAQSRQVVVEGVIKNYQNHTDADEGIEIVGSDFITDGIVVSALVDSKGSFKLVFPLFSMQDVALKYKENIIILLLSPGGNLKIEFDTVGLSGPVTFKGDLANLNEEVLAYERAEEAFRKERYGKSRFARDEQESEVRLNSSPEKFKSFIYERLQTETDFYNKYLLHHPTSGEFKKWAKAHIEYGNAFSLIRYLMYHEKEKDKIFKSNYFDFFNRFPLENKEASSSSNYMIYLDVYRNNYFHNYHNPSIKIPTISKLILEEPSLLSEKEKRRLEKISQKKESSFSILDALFISKIMTVYEDNTVVQNKLEELVFLKFIETIIQHSEGFVKDVLLSSFIYQLIQDGYPDVASKNIDLIQANVATAYFRETIDALLATKNLKPEDYPLAIFPQDYRLPISNDDSIFHLIIQQYEGKVIYIDFWGTWCAPCREEMPHSKALWQNFQDKDVVFLYLGVQSKQDVWQSTIAALQIPGEHYLLKNSEYAALRSKFNIVGIPHYMLIDRNGRIRDAQAKAPSTKALKKEIEDLL